LKRNANNRANVALHLHLRTIETLALAIEARDQPAFAQKLCKTSAYQALFCLGAGSPHWPQSRIDGSRKGKREEGDHQNRQSKTHQPHLHLTLYPHYLTLPSPIQPPPSRRPCLVLVPDHPPASPPHLLKPLFSPHFSQAPNTSDPQPITFFPHKTVVQSSDPSPIMAPLMLPLPITTPHDNHRLTTPYPPGTHVLFQLPTERRLFFSSLPLPSPFRRPLLFPSPLPSFPLHPPLSNIPIQLPPPAL